MGGLYLEQEHEVQHYEAAFEDIWGTALDERASVAVIKQAAKELRA